MKTYEDLISTDDKMRFTGEAITEYKGSPLYREAHTAYDYFRRRNVTINQYQKLLYKMNGETVPDNYSANYKFCNAFFPIFVRQENSYLLGNGVTFNKDDTKDRLGGDDFDGGLGFHMDSPFTAWNPQTVRLSASYLYYSEWGHILSIPRRG